MAVIKVPKTPKKSYNPHRKPSALLLDQVRHLQWAALPAKQRKPKAMAKRPLPKTEWQAAEHIRALTALVQANEAADAQRALAAPQANYAPVRLPSLPRAPKQARPTARRAKRRRAVAANTRAQVGPKGAKRNRSRVAKRKSRVAKGRKRGGRRNRT